MGKLYTKNTLLPSFVFMLCGFMLVSCSATDTPIQPSPFQTISGRVLDMPALTPLAGATLEVVNTNVDATDPDFMRNCECMDPPCPTTTSDADGRWTLENVPVIFNPSANMPYDFLIRVTAPDHPPAFNIYQLALGERYDMMTVNSLFFCLFSLEALLSGVSPGDLCVMMGAVIGFADMDYPQQTVPLAGAAAQASGGTPPQNFPITYLSEEGLPDPDMTETSSAGAFYFVVPDAHDDAMPSIEIAGTMPGATLVGGYFPACPGSFVPVGLIDPFYSP